MDTEDTTMATINRQAENTAYVPPISDRELTRRNAEAIRLLDLWEDEGDEDEQRDAMDAIRTALGPGRDMGYRGQVL